MSSSREGIHLLVLTIGHSTRPLEEFINLLRASSVTLVADVRSIPRSRHNPQFNKESLPGALEVVKIEYRHLKGLGGLHHPIANSVNTGWKNASFRGFADYMQTAEFQTSLDELLILSEGDQVALMCAEIVPWRCHRSLIADALLIRRIEVRHILSGTEARSHILTPWAQANGTGIK